MNSVFGFHIKTKVVLQRNYELISYISMHQLNTNCEHIEKHCDVHPVFTNKKYENMLPEIERAIARLVTMKSSPY